MKRDRHTIVVNGRFTSQRKTGMQRFASELVLALDRRLSADLEFDVELLLPPNGTPLEKLNVVKQRRIGSLTGHLWEQLDLPRHLRDSILVNLCASGPVFGGRQLLVIHDAAIFDNPQNYSPRYRQAYRALWRLLRQSNTMVATVSAFSASRLAAHGIAANPAIIPNGCDHLKQVVADETVFSRFPKIERCRYLLAVGNRSPNKNFGIILQAFQGMREQHLQLVICGEANVKVFGSVANLQSKTLVEIPPVNDSELKALYASAFTFLFPSLYEGFGIPPLEAMSVGCPTVVARSGAIPEVCGDAALYFNSGSSTELADAIQSLRTDASLRATLVERGYRRAEMFQWGQSVERLLEQLRRMAR